MSSPSCASSRSSRATRTAPSGSPGPIPGTRRAPGSTGSSTGCRSSASATQPATTGGRCAASRSAPILIGGHIDSVPNGGWLDGCLNVVAGAEVLRRIAEQGTPPVTIRLVNWADEEGARFGRSLFGSSAAGGSMTRPGRAAPADRQGRDLAPRRPRRERRRPRPGARGAIAARLGRGLPRAPHRAGAGARVDGHSARRRARHLRRRALAHHVDGPGRARRLDADGQAPRRARRRGEARARAARDRRRRSGTARSAPRAASSAGPGSSPPSSRPPSSSSTSVISTPTAWRSSSGWHRRRASASPPRRTSRSPGSGSGTSSRSCSTRR